MKKQSSWNIEKFQEFFASKLFLNYFFQGRGQKQIGLLG